MEVHRPEPRGRFAPAEPPTRRAAFVHLQNTISMLESWRRRFGAEFDRGLRADAAIAQAEQLLQDMTAQDRHTAALPFGIHEETVPATGLLETRDPGARAVLNPQDPALPLALLGPGGVYTRNVGPEGPGLDLRA